MKKFTVYFKLFGKLYKFNIEDENIKTQKEAEDYVIKKLIPGSIEFFESSNIKSSSSEFNNKIDKTLEDVGKQNDKTLEESGKQLDKAFNKLNSIFDGFGFKDTFKKKE